MPKTKRKLTHKQKLAGFGGKRVQSAAKSHYAHSIKPKKRSSVKRQPAKKRSSGSSKAKTALLATATGLGGAALGYAAGSNLGGIANSVLAGLQNLVSKVNPEEAQALAQALPAIANSQTQTANPVQAVPIPVVATPAAPDPMYYATNQDNLPAGYSIATATGQVVPTDMANLSAAELQAEGWG